MQMSTFLWHPKQYQILKDFYPGLRGTAWQASPPPKLWVPPEFWHSAGWEKVALIQQEITIIVCAPGGGGG